MSSSVINDVDEVDGYCFISKFTCEEASSLYLYDKCTHLFFISQLVYLEIYVNVEYDMGCIVT